MHELHLPGRVVDRIVDVAHQQDVADVDALAALADLEAVEGQHGPVVGCRRLDVQPQGEHRGRRLRREIRTGRPVERVVALGRAQPGRIRERRQVRKDDELIAHRIALIGIAPAGKQPVVLVELVRIVIERDAEHTEIRLAGRRALALVDHQGERHGLAGDLPASDAVGIADLEPERRRRRRDSRLGIVDQPEGVDHRRIAVHLDRKGPNRVGAGAGDVGDRKVIVLIEPIGEREPGAGRIDVIVFPFFQNLPLERPGALARAVDGLALRARAAGDRAHASGVLISRLPWRHGAAPVHAQGTDGERLGPRRLIE